MAKTRIGAFMEKFDSPEKAAYKKKYAEAYEKALAVEMGKKARTNARSAAKRKAEGFGRSRLSGVANVLGNFGENMGKLASDPALGRIIENTEQFGGFGRSGGRKSGGGQILGSGESF